MKELNEVVLSQPELKTLRRVFNALSGVPFVRTQKPAFDCSALENRLRSAATTEEVIFSFDHDEVETMLKALDAVTAEYPDASSLQLYLGSREGEIAQVKRKLGALAQAPA